MPLKIRMVTRCFTSSKITIVVIDAVVAVHEASFCEYSIKAVPRLFKSVGICVVTRVCSHAACRQVSFYYFSMNFPVLTRAFLQELQVYAPPGNLVGTVVQRWAIFQPLFDINDHEGKTVLKIEGPVCPCSMCVDVEFNVNIKIIFFTKFYNFVDCIRVSPIIIVGFVLE